MLWPLQDTFRFVGPHIPRALVSARARSGLSNVVKGLPEAVSCSYLECRLRPGSTDQVDLGVGVLSAEGRRALLTAFAPAQSVQGEDEQVVWRRINDFIRVWTDHTSSINERIPCIWLEFDSEMFEQGRVFPSLLFCLDPMLVGGVPVDDEAIRHDVVTCLPVVDEALSLLRGQVLAPQPRSRLAACFEQLPPGGRIAHIGVMLARRPVVLKLFIALPRGQVLRYLDAIEWPGSMADLEALLATFCTDSEDFRVELTLDTAVCERISLEFASRGVADQGRRALVNRCVAQGLCTPDKRDALLAWPGSTHALYPGDAWPTRLVRWIDVKVVYAPPRPLEAKAYLGFMPYFSLF